MKKFTCKNCGQKISLPPKYSGKKAKCPQCKNIIEFPAHLPNSDQADDLTHPNNQKTDESPPASEQADAPLLTIPTPKIQPQTPPPSDRDFSEEIDELLSKDQKHSAAQIPAAWFSGCALVSRQFGWLAANRRYCDFSGCYNSAS